MPIRPEDKKRRQTAKLFKSLRRTAYRASLMPNRDSVRYDANQTPIQKQENPILARRNAANNVSSSGGSEDKVQVMHETHVAASKLRRNVDEEQREESKKDRELEVHSTVNPLKTNKKWNKSKRTKEDLANNELRIHFTHFLYIYSWHFYCLF